MTEKKQLDVPLIEGEIRKKKKRVKTSNEHTDVEVQFILDEKLARNRNGQLEKQYLIKWKDRPDIYNEWVWERDIAAPEIMQNWKKTKEMRKRLRIKEMAPEPKKRTLLRPREHSPVLLCFLTLCFINCATGFQAFDCSQPKVSKQFSASHIQTCEFNKKPVIQPIGKRELALIQKDHYINVPVTKCRLEFKAFIWNCGSGGDHYIREDKYPVKIELTYDECKRALEEKWMPLKVNNKRITNLKLGITVQRVNIFGWSDRSGYCSKDQNFVFDGWDYSGNMAFYVRAKLVQEEETFNIEDGTLVSTGEDCKIQDKYCILAEETIIIDSAWTTNFCSFSLVRSIRFDVYSVSNNSKVFKESVSVKQLEDKLLVSEQKRKMIRIITGTKEFACETHVYPTNYKNIYIVDVSMRFRFKKLSATDVQLPIQFDSKLYYVDGDLHDKLREIYITLQSQVLKLKILLSLLTYT